MVYKRPRSAVDQSSPPVEYMSYGTALPPSDLNAKDEGSYVPLWKQEVTDERGRKRLHGAFTGGFSAGYFNTVGSKEGWAPSTFTSSRSSRATASQQRPEDYMDEEDRREAEEAKTLEMNRDYAGIGVNCPEDRIDLLISSLKDTHGLSLLRKMGWRDGEAVGAKSKRQTRTHGNSLPTLPRPKNDLKGLGFSQESNAASNISNTGDRPSFSPTAAFVAKTRKKKGPAFGIGILNDEDDEDDPYAIKPKSSYNIAIGGEKTKNRIPSRTGKHVFVSKKSTTPLAPSQKCHDGSLALPDFRVSQHELQVPPKDVYQFPTVPEDWIPVVTEGHGQAATSVIHKAMDPSSRGQALGESPLQGKSVFSYISAENRDRIAALTGNKRLPPGLGEVPLGMPSNTGSSMESLVPPLEPSIAQSALDHTSMPYADDPSKRVRYRSFLEIKAGLRDGLPERKYGMHTQDWIKEMNEFVGAARIFRPLAASMANRFTSSTSRSSEGNMGAHGQEQSDTPLRQPAVTVHDASLEAADLGMYGPLTRSVLSFTPTRLLCKRFNVPLPVGVPDDDGSSSGRPHAGMDPQYSSAVPSEPVTMDVAAPGGKAPKTMPVDPNRNIALEEERAADSVFRAVFGDEDDDE